MSTKRILGKLKLIKQDKPIYGIVIGDADGEEYFLIPSLMAVPSEFFFLTPGEPLEFTPFLGNRGWRATDCTPVLSNRKAGDHAETSQG